MKNDMNFASSVDWRETARDAAGDARLRYRRLPPRYAAAVARMSHRA